MVDYRVGLSNKPGFSMISLGGEINLLDTILGIHVKNPLSLSLSKTSNIHTKILSYNNFERVRVKYLSMSRNVQEVS